MFTFMCEHCSGTYPLYLQHATGWCYACHTGTTMPEGSVLCHTCNGYGTYVMGSIVNGRPTGGQMCFCCIGKGYMTEADVVRDNRAHEAQAYNAIMGDIRQANKNTEEEKEVKVMNNNQYGVPVSEKGIACAACSYWEDGKKVVVHHATVAMVKLCSHRHNEAKANS